MKPILLLFCAMFLCVGSGCSVFNPYNEEFLCQGKTSNGKCSDMGQTYQNVQHADNSLVITEPQTQATLSTSEQKYRSAVLNNQASRIQQSMSPVRKRSKVMRMLMLDYTDKDILFGSRYIWFLNDKPAWIVPGGQ